MGFKKDIKRARSWLDSTADNYLDETWDEGDGDAFCWDLIQRLNQERIEWKGTAHAWENLGAHDAVTIENLQRKVEELAAEAAHWKTQAETRRPQFNAAMKCVMLSLAGLVPSDADLAAAGIHREGADTEPAVGGI